MVPSCDSDFCLAQVEVNRIVGSSDAATSDAATSGAETTSSTGTEGGGGLFKYFSMADGAPAVELDKTAPIAAVFAEFVERYLYYDGSKSLSAMDSGRL